MKRFFTRMLLCSSALAALISQADAQSTAPPPPYYSLDGNNVDLATGAFVYNRTDISIGTGTNALSYSHLTNSMSGTFYPTTYQLQFGGSNKSLATITLNGVVDQLTSDATNHWSTTHGTGTQLSTDGSGKYTYLTHDGTTILFIGVPFGVVPTG